MHKSESEKVTIIILSRDRIKYCEKAIESALLQSYGNCRIVISENSESDEVSRVISEKFNNVEIVRRVPSLSSFEHFNKIIEEFNTDYTVIFHDDDVLEPDYTINMIKIFRKYPSSIAVACNAKIIYGDIFSNDRIMKCKEKISIIRSPKDLLRRYMAFDGDNPAPFPAYMYRATIFPGMKFDIKNGGKYSDVSFLCEVAEKGEIVWTNEASINYRIHENNDSKKNNIEDRLKLIRYINRKGYFNDKELMRNYRYLFWLQWFVNIIKTSEFSVKKFKNFTITKFLIINTVKLFFKNPIIILTFLKKMQKKR